MGTDLATVTLGRTGLEVSVAGLGCGGHSRLGQSRGVPVTDSVALVRRALDLGVTFIDTAAAYGTEEIVGTAIRGHRDDVVLSTKSLVVGRSGDLITGPELRSSVESSLERLGTDHVDLFHLHGVESDQYPYCRTELVPVLAALRDEGKIGWLAVSERFIRDPGHEMLRRAVPDGCWDVVMVGFNPLNPSARHRVLAPAIDGDIGVLVMFAVRRALSDPVALRQVVADLVGSGRVDGTTVDLDGPLGFLVGDGVASSVVEAAYRFARHETGTHVVLTGTGSIEHLEQNLDALALGPLPEVALARLDALFGHLDVVHGD